MAEIAQVFLITSMAVLITSAAVFVLVLTYKAFMRE